MNDVIGSILGTATFKRVSVYREEGKIHVLGTYVDDDTTHYEAPPGSIRVGGLEMTVGDHEVVTFTPDDDDGWVWVEATEDKLHITSEERDD